MDVQQHVCWYNVLKTDMVKKLIEYYELEKYV